MNDIEDRLRQAFQAEAKTVRAHPGAHEENRRRLRRAAVRRRVAAPAAAVAVTATTLVTYGLVQAGAKGDPEPGTPQPTGSAMPPVSPSPSPGPTGKVQMLRGAIPISGTVTIRGRLPGGGDFAAGALGTDGSVLGMDADQLGSSSGATVWEAGSRGGTPSSLKVRAQGGLATGPGFRTWMQGFDLKCRTPGRKDQVISPQSADVGGGFWADGGTLVWHDIMRQPFTTQGCKRGRMVDNHGKPDFGRAMAFSYPHLFVVDASNDKVLREVDLRANRILAEHPLPPGAGNEGWYAAANRDVFASVVNGVLRVIDRRTWRQKTALSERVPAAAPGTRPTMSAGDRIVAYSVETAGQGRQSLLYDTVTGRSVNLPGPVFAAGGWLLWRDGSDYRLARVG